MPIRDLLVIPLPRGKTGVTGHCSVYFAPRLRESGELRDYADWRDWPAFLPGLVTNVRVNGGPVGFSVTSAPSSPVYHAVFKPRTKVTRYAFVNRSGTSLRSFAGGTLADQVRNLYAAAATAFPDQPPSATDLLALGAASDLFAGDELEEATEYADKVGTGVPDEPDDTEFHEWLTLLANHPHLLRLLGIVVDLDVNLTGIASPASIEVLTNYTVPAQGRRAVHAITKTTTAFLGLPDPDPDRKELNSGWLRCALPEISLHQIDPIGATVRVGPIGEAGTNDIDGSGALPADQRRHLSAPRQPGRARRRPHRPPHGAGGRHRAGLRGRARHRRAVCRGRDRRLPVRHPRRHHGPVAVGVRADAGRSVPAPARLRPERRAAP